MLSCVGGCFFYFFGLSTEGGGECVVIPVFDLVTWRTKGAAKSRWGFNECRVTLKYPASHSRSHEHPCWATAYNKYFHDKLPARQAVQLSHREESVYLIWSQFSGKNASGEKTWPQINSAIWAESRKEPHGFLSSDPCSPMQCLRVINWIAIKASVAQYIIKDNVISRAAADRYFLNLVCSIRLHCKCLFVSIDLLFARHGGGNEAIVFCSLVKLQPIHYIEKAAGSWLEISYSIYGYTTLNSLIMD